MRLYQEILLLDGYFDGYYCIENVISWYEPLIEPQKLGRHYFWANFEIPEKEFDSRGGFDKGKGLAEKLEYDISNWKGVDKRLLLRNCTEPEVGKYIYDKYLEAKGETTSSEDDMQMTIFDFIGGNNE